MRNLANRVAASLGGLAYVGEAVMALNGPAIAQGGLTASFSVTHNVMASRARIAGLAAWHDAIQIKIHPGPARAPAPASVPLQPRRTTGKFYGYSFGWSSRAQAEREALANCNRQAGEANACEVAIWFSDGCGALAIGSDGAWGADWSETASEASAKALKACRSEDDSGACEVVKSFCSQ
jgi:hypothetical protein